MRVCPQADFIRVVTTRGAVDRRHVATLLHADAVEMHYQPILDLKAGQVGKMEALARLRDGDRLLAPAEFLPHCGPDELFVLYARGLEHALRARETWLKEGVDLTLSLNLPPGALGDERYFEVTREMLARHQSPAQTLTLEVLESGAIDATEAASERCRRFDELGVCLAEDDLGSGHSSLTRLRELPFDWIKIDRSIVRLTGNDNVEVLHFIYQLTRLGHALGKTVIVEGVENADLIDAVQILGADAVQGYGIAKPMPPDRVVPWIRAWVRRASGSRAQTPLAKLATLLILEERLHLARLDGPSGRRGKRNAKRGCIAAAASPDLSWGTRQLDRFRTEVDAIYSGECECEAHKDALLQAVQRQGLGSPAYRQARRQLAASAWYRVGA